MWTYSPSSEVFLNRFMDSVRPPDENNKWVKNFKRNITDNALFEENTCSENIIDVQEIPDSGTDVEPAEIHEDTLEYQNAKDLFPGLANENTLLEQTETDLQEKFPDLYNVLLSSPQLFPKLAEKLTINSIHKLTLLIVGLNNLDQTFLENFFKHFFPAFLRREYSWQVLDILVIAYKNQPELFRQYVLVEMLKNCTVSNKSLLSFVETLNENDQILFVTKILETELSKAEFSHNLVTIFTFYKNCKKNYYIQTRMQKILLENSDHCAKENTFGKLLLFFLQQQKHFGKLTEIEHLKKCIDRHQTPFRKPCINILQEILSIHPIEW